MATRKRQLPILSFDPHSWHDNKFIIICTSGAISDLRRFALVSFEKWFCLRGKMKYYCNRLNSTTEKMRWARGKTFDKHLEHCNFHSVYFFFEVIQKLYYIILYTIQAYICINTKWLITICHIVYIRFFYVFSVFM